MAEETRTTPTFNPFRSANKSSSTSCWKRDAVEERLKAHELEIVATENALKSLQEKRYELHELLNSTSLIMSSLPLDVLTEIFSLACTDVDSPHRNLSHVPVQFIIGRVCRAWRRIAWATPRLWTNISLEFAKDRYEMQVCLLLDWLGRTANCPLDLYFSVAHSSLQWEPPLHLFYALLETSHQWRSFCYPFRSVNFPLALADLREEELQFPILTTLTLFGKTRNPEELDEWWLNLPPQLQNLTVNGQRKFHLDIDWGCLTTLSAKFDLPGCMTLLDLVLSIETLNLTVIGHNRPFSTNDTDTQYIMPHLRSLSIEGGRSTVGSLFNRMTMPLLKKLKINLYDDHFQDALLESLVEMTRRSSFQLTSLIIKQECERQERPLLDLLWKMPSVEHFELNCTNLPAFKLTNQSINQFNPTLQTSSGSNPRDFLPNLKTFRFTGYVDFSPNDLLEMVQERFESVQSQLRASQREVSPFSEKLRVEIMYLNASWHRMQNPNIWSDLYLAIATMSSQGLAFVLEWAQDNDSDSDSDSDNY